MQEEANKILEFAKQYNVDDNYLFKTTFQLYQSQLEIIDTLKSEWKKSGVIVKKQYTKGSSNLYINPAIREYNKAIAETNRTANVLIKLIKDISSLKQENNTNSAIDVLQGLGVIE